METYYGHVRTPADAIILFEACRIGLLPRVQRRLSEKERQSIRSGSVFVWDEREAGMRRWTDGKSWSASRVSGSFLTYREMEGKRGGNVTQSTVVRTGKTPESTRGSDDDRGDVDDGPDGYRYKPDGLMKQSFSITTSAGQHLHLISYYARSHPSAATLSQPSTDPNLRHVRPQKGLYPESTVNDQQNLPVVTRGPMAGATYPIATHPIGPYPRSGATHPQSYAPHYAWPPTPLPTPPTVAVPYGSPYLPPVSAANGHITYGHQPLPPPQPPLSAPYDRPGHTVEAPVHHPMPPNGHIHSLPAYPGRSPRSVAEHQPSPPAYGSSPHTPNHTISQPNGLAAPSPSRNSAYLPPATNGIKQEPSSSATQVPSIGALVNGAGRGPLPPITGGSVLSSLDSRAPDGPKDIPTEKIPCGGEDMRALRQLDRVFSA
ncbi:Gti1/Pac2 family [Aspergillus sclerotialis]|uniref:Gti1/Pac2 family n=1 Tax=Aspergillus sclerotialis TaxID=2070753 RepID=A0A3A2ZEZ9_9EURO|nr:Gti1/Pac2 family [Aspergillus sclerotialis]